MLRTSLLGLNRRRLRLWLGVFFLALAIPTGVLIHHAYGQLKWEAFHQHRVQAEELAARIDNRLVQAIDREEARSFADYTFLVVEGDWSVNYLQRSPLAAFPVAAEVPGLLGYFQIDPQGAFTTPLLPPEDATAHVVGISLGDRDERAALQARIARILSENRLVPAGQRATADTAGASAARRKDRRRAPADALADANENATPRVEALEQHPSQAAFDNLSSGLTSQTEQEKQADRSLGRVEDLKLDSAYSARVDDEMPDEIPLEKAPPSAKRASRKEISAVPTPRDVATRGALEADAASTPSVQFATFESEIDPFEVGLLDSGHFVLFRKVFRDGQRYIQGALVDQGAFLRETIEAEFRRTSLSRMSDLAVAYEGNVMTAFSSRSSDRYPASSEELTGALLYRTRLSAPFNHVELLLSVTRLPAGPGAKVIAWVAGILVLVLCGGLFLMYRLGARQIDLTAQQQDFVSAVSHELKTPLTSIRMYGEMLRDGWAPEQKKRTYYEYIFQESERLSRLIANVLQLARLTRNEFDVELKPMTAAELTDGIRSKVSSQIERAGFELALACPEEIGTAVVHVDPDCFSQIVINLVDNALKFSAKAALKTIEIGWRRQAGNAIVLSVRDHGPGVRKDQMRKIFRLFYRSENELTRETVGTGIGLALVHQLAQAMDASVDVVNRDPGAEFTIAFPQRRE
ncbi:MAG: sensor histidine kinase [Gammaproteobacteria bacterium]